MDTTHGDLPPEGTTPDGTTPESTTPHDASGPSWAPPQPGSAYVLGTAPAAPTTVPQADPWASPPPPAADPWTSPLWGRPETVAGHWPAPDPADRVDLGAAAVAPARRRGTSRGLVAGLAAVIAATLVGVGVVRALPRDASEPVSAPPSVSAPAAQPGDPGQTDPGQTDPGQDPLQGLLPGLGQAPQGQPSAGPQGGSTGSSSAVDQAAVAAVAPALVNITTAIGYDGNQAAGTGVVLTSDGYVLTNHHVIAGSTSIRVAVAGTARAYDADVVGYDATHDIAVIKLRGASGLTTAPLGDSSSVAQGDAVIGLGNAGGRDGAPIPAAGTVTGLDRAITAMDSENGTSEQLSGLIETDANIEPGDSGGALVSSEGKVVGIITAGSVGQSRTRSGVSTVTDGYAVPINQALAIAQDIRDGRASGTVHIGASAFLGIQVAGAAAGGIPVSGVVSGSAAERAGLTPGSVITALDGHAVSTNSALRALIAPHHPGDSVSVTWITASGAQRTADVTLGSGPVA